MNLDLIVRGGLVVDAGNVRRYDVGVRNGRVAVLADRLEDLLAPGGREVDATGCYVLPGGVDVHTHLAQLSAHGRRTADDFFTGTRAAAHGGTTTVLAFAAQHRGAALTDVVATGLAAAREACVDVGLHLIVTDFSDPGAAKALSDAADCGIASLKVFLTYDKLRLDDAELLSVVDTARRLGMTVMVHAEHHGMVSFTTQRLVMNGETTPASHRRAHSRDAEAAAIAEISAIGAYLDVPIYLVHLSSRDALVAVRHARAQGVRITGETCPHYLFLDEDRLEGPIAEAVQSMCSPPLRAGPDRDALWQALRDGELTVVASDHAPYRLDDGKLPYGEETTFTQCANGIPGVEVRMPLLFSEAITGGRLSLPEVVALCCEQPARVMGLHPRKGSLQIGADADLAVWDPTAEWTVTAAGLHDAMDHTPYEGIEIVGRPTLVVSGGEVVVDEDGDHLARGRGRFLARMPDRTVAP